MLDKYKPSGKFGSSMLALVAPGLLVAVAIGAVYEVLLEVIPLIYLNFFTCIFGVIAVGSAAAVIVKKSKCRNVGVAAVFGLAMGLTAWVTSFVVIWQYVRWKYNVPHVSFVTYLQERAKIGLSIGHIGSGPSSSPPISGIFMDILWGVEGIAFLAGSSLIAARRARIPFCEACQSWAEHVKLKFTMERPTPDAVAAVTKAQGVAEVVPDPSQGIGQGPDGSGLFYTVKGCEKCASVDHVDVVHSYTVIQAKKVQQKTNKLHESILIGPEELEALRAYAGPVAEAPPAEPPAAAPPQTS